MIFDKMCNSVTGIIASIYTHPFNQELSSGVLPKEKFIRYLIQDALYLSDFSRALSLTAARLTDNVQSKQFIEFSLGAINAENDLHQRYLKKYQIDSKKVKKQSPACFMYTNYLLKQASMASVQESVAALLPCFWVYSQVGKGMLQQLKENNPYQDWIVLYASTEFENSVRQAIDITNHLGEFASEEIKRKMLAAFVCATEMEWLFWDHAYHGVEWCVK